MELRKNGFQDILESADVRLNGDRPWDVQVHDDRIYARILREGTLGMGEAYMDKWWDCEQIDRLVNRIYRKGMDHHLLKVSGLLISALIIRIGMKLSLLLDRQSRKQAREVGEQHYDIGNELYQAMLDKRMNYTCAYWRGASDLDQAQENKLRLVCEKLNLQPGMRILDIGCGWGGFAAYAAKHYQVEVVGVTISENQLSLGQEMCSGLPVELRFQDYRDIDETFDAVVSLGMFEHVGWKNYRHYMEKVSELLRDKGLFLMQTIGNKTSTLHGDAWLNRYIFPHGMLPSVKQIGEAAEDCLVVEDWQNFGGYYDKTLMAWHERFNRHWPAFKHKYSDRFRRMWNFYLLTCAGLFRARSIFLWQIVFSKNGTAGVYQRIGERTL